MEFGVVFQHHHGVDLVVLFILNIILDVVGADAVASKQSVDRCATLVCQTTDVVVWTFWRSGGPSETNTPISQLLKLWDKHIGNPFPVLVAVVDSIYNKFYWVSRNLVGINFRHPNVMPNFAVWKTITYRHWHKWCCQPRFYITSR